MAEKSEWVFRCLKCLEEFILMGDHFDFSDVSCIECYSGNVELIDYDFANRELYLEKLLRKKVVKKTTIEKYVENKNFINTKKPVKNLLN
jgi:hypothetical protein